MSRTHEANPSESGAHMITFNPIVDVTSGDGDDDGSEENFARAAPEAVHAGFPSPATGYYNGPVDLNRHLIQDPTATFIVRVSGDSMTGAGIFDGDEIIVDRSLDARDGSVVIAVVDNELTIKRLRIDEAGIRLVPENPAYPDIVLDEMSELTIWGVVTRCLHRV